MNFIKKFMIKNPLLSIFIISPFTFFFISSLFDIILHFFIAFPNFIMDFKLGLFNYYWRPMEKEFN